MKLLFTSIFILVTYCVAAQIPTSGLVAFYPFCGNANDVSGNGHHLRDSGATLTTDRYGISNAAYQFNGIDNMLYKDTAFPLSSDFTYTFWMLADTIQDGVVVYNGNGNINGNGIVFDDGAAVIGTKVTMMEGGICFCMAVTSTLHKWHFITSRRSSGTFNLFIDTVKVATTTSVFNTPCCKFALGLDYTDGTNPYKGKIDDVAIYNRALSDSEIKLIYRTQLPTTVTLSICSGSSGVTLSVLGVKSYTWAPSSTLSCANCANPVATPTIKTTYTVSGVDTYGCSIIDTFIVKVGNPPPLMKGPNKTVCKGTSASISASGASSYSWSPAGSLSCTACSTPTATPTVTTRYIVIGSDTSGCTKTDSVTVNVLTLPTVSTGTDKIICKGDSVLLSATGAKTYSWTPTTGLSCGTCYNPVAKPTTTTNYIVTGTDSNGCTNTATVRVTVNPLPTVSAGSAISICSGISATLSATGASSYIWSPSTGLSCATCGSTIAMPVTTTKYIVTGTDINGCINKDSVTITVKPLPLVTATGSKSICYGDRAPLRATGAVSYKWAPPAGLTCATCDTTTATPGATTIYTVTGTAANSCTDTASVTITVNPLPVLITTPDTTICSGQTFTLAVSGANTYTWTPPAGLSCTNCTNPVASPAKTITYTVTGKDNNGCSAQRNVAVTVIPKNPVTINAGATICAGTTYQLLATGGDAYTWYPSYALSNTAISDPVAHPDTTVTYSVSIKQANCFADTLTTTIKVNALPTLHVSGGQTVLAGSTVQLFATGTGILKYQWSPPEGLDCTDCESPQATPLKTTTYMVKVTGVGGCEANGEATVTISCDNSRVFIPNTFTPNGDGNNDRFYPSGKGLSSIKRFSIYDRWGEEIYHVENILLNDQLHGWDGSFNGKQLKPDVFVYMIEATCDFNEPVLLKGAVTLMR
ncbi:MAG: gliding motility-associated C-terminal domain-containing protein [Taibaiella sp.]|nr:gliding motility-associated C-terminal domain-containing protein [Taibaiella sp.]